MKKIISLIILVVVCFLLFRFCKTGSMEQALGDLKNKTADVAGGAVDGVGNVAKGAADLAGKAADTAGNVAGGAADLAGDVAGGAAEAVGNAAKGAADVAGGAAEAVGNAAGGVADGAKGLVKMLTPSIKKNDDGSESIAVSKIFFQSGTANIDSKSFSYITSIASFIKGMDSYSKIRVEGHTDSSGDAEANKRLSKQRANAVVKLLVEAGVDADKVYSTGLGASSPIATNDTSEGKAQNRRVEFDIER